jgi:hypothetical protein
MDTNNTTLDSFDFDNYRIIIEQKIKTILERQQKDIITFDVLDTEQCIENKKIALKEKQRQMKKGEIWQCVIGNYMDYEDLKVGHKTGLDIINHKKKQIIELKNRTNTDNASSRKSNLSKLVKFKKENPDYTCIYACINTNVVKIKYYK